MIGNCFGRPSGMSSQDRLLGLTPEEFKKQVAPAPVRITIEDGKSFMGTCDYRTERYNLTVEKGRVVSYSMG